VPEAGEVVTGRVVSLTQFGAFVQIQGGPVGLLHKSEMAHERIDDPAKVVKIGDEVEAKVIEVRREGGKLRVGLSRRAILPAPPPGQAQPAPRREHNDRPHGHDRKPPRQGDRPEARSGGGGGVAPRRDDRRNDRGGDRGRERDRDRDRREQAPDDDFPVEGKFASLGEMILAKLKSQRK
jgi:predicted RNA-binding protein with RPS1 domain